MNALPVKKNEALARLLADTLQARLERLDDHTKRSYNRGVAQFEEWLQAQGLTDPPIVVLQGLKHHEANLLIEAYLTHLLYGPEPYARATVESRFAALKWAVREAHAAGELPWLLAARMPKPRKGKDGRSLEKGGRNMTGPTPREALDMLAACDTVRDRLLFQLCRIEGFRIHEIRQINYEDIEENNWVLMHRKKRRGIERFRLSLPTFETLQAYLEERGRGKGPLFIGRKGRFSMRGLSGIITRISERAGVPNMSPHRIRHRACTDIVRYCVRKGIPEEDMLRLTGHSSRRALQPYYEHDRVERSSSILDGVSDMYDENGELKW